MNIANSSQNSSTIYSSVKIACGSTILQNSSTSSVKLDCSRSSIAKFFNKLSEACRIGMHV
jgi:hypothetical protein